jgi:preprotein translocase subunit YajC
VNLTILLAQAAEGGGGAGAPAGCMGGQGVSSLVMMLLMFVVFYLVLIRPQQKKAKEHQNMLSNLKKGDTVITRGGVVGKISGVTDTVLVIEVQEKVRIRVAKSYVDGLFREDNAKASVEKADKSPPSPEAKS